MKAELKHFLITKSIKVNVYVCLPNIYHFITYCRTGSQQKGT